MQDISRDQIRALLKLLEDPSEREKAFLKQALSAAIKNNPTQVQQVLSQEFADPAPRAIVHTLEEICWEDLEKAFARFAAKINPDLEEGLSLLAKFTSPTMERGKIAEPVDEMAFELRTVMLNARNYREMARAMAHYIFDVRQYKTIPSAKQINDLSFPHFLRKKQGSGLCTACLYMCLGQRYGMNMEVVDLAGRILISLQDEIHQDTFAIDPFNQGQILSPQDCKAYLKTRNLTLTDTAAQVLSSRLLVRRFLANMIYLLNKINDTRRLTYVRNYLQLITE